MGARGTSYKTAGVSLEAGDEASRLMFEASRRTWGNRRDLAGEVVLAHEGFSAVRYACACRFGDGIVGMNFDGVGTKIEVAERVGDHTTIAYDLLAMVCDDAAREGGEPVWVGSILDFRHIDVGVVAQLAEGMVKAANEAGVAVVNGEIAELGYRVGGRNPGAYNWGAAVFWIARRENLLLGRKICDGQAVVAVRERGLRSNGLSLVRKVLARAYGREWHCHEFGETNLGRAILEPSRIYTRLLIELVGGYERSARADIRGVAHITGGGIPGKLGRLLSAHRCGADLDDLFAPCEVMTHCQEVGRVEDREAYRVWNMGNGLLIVSSEPEEVLRTAEELGFEAKIAGKIRDDPSIRIMSKGLHKARNPLVVFDLQI